MFIYFLVLLWEKSDSENDIKILEGIEIKCRENWYQHVSLFPVDFLTISLHLPIIKRQNILASYFPRVHDFSRNIVGSLTEGALGYTGDSYVIFLYWLILTIFKYTFKLQGFYKVKLNTVMLIMKRVYLQHPFRKTGIYDRSQSQLTFRNLASHI